MKTWKMVTIIMFFIASPAFAGQDGLVEEWSVLFPSFQYFTWDESLPAGPRAVKEEGLIVGTGAAVRLNLYDKKLMLKLRGDLFGGDVDYDGHTQPDTGFIPVKTDVIYFGVRAEGDLGWRIPINDFSVEPFAGIGYRWWLRSLQGTVFTAGTTEYWMSIYGRLGARGTWKLTNDVELFAEGGAKCPFYNENRADVLGESITVRPGSDWSAFGEIGITYRRFRPSVYYEGFRFSQSSVKHVPFTPIGVFQPRSDSDIIGVNFSWVF